MRTNPHTRATLALADGTIIHGVSVGAPGTTVAELILNTASSGTQELLTDPANTGQLLCFSAPQIGNGGIEGESGKIPTMYAAGILVRQMARHVSNHHAIASLPEALIANGCVGIGDVDTRSLFRHIRDAGVMNAVISTEHHDWETLKPFLDRAENLADQPMAQPLDVGTEYPATGSSVADAPIPAGVDNSDGKPTGTPPAEPFRVALVSFGSTQSIAVLLAAAGCNVHIVGPDVDPATLTDGSYDGVVLGNGPGNPGAHTDGIALAKAVLDAKVPVFGICLGHHLLAAAAGVPSTKMHHGHHGANHPVRNLVSDLLDELERPGEWLIYLEKPSAGVDISSQNHRYVVDTKDLGSTPFGPVVQTFVNLTDGTNAGLAFIDRPAFSVQFHPQGSPGSHDSRYLFDQFTQIMTHNRAK